MLLELFSCFLLIMYKYSGFFSKAQSKEQHFWLLSTPTRNGWMIQMSRPTTAAVIDALRALFSTFGLPHKIVSVNGRTFVSAEIRRFYKDNGITALSHCPVPPSIKWPSRTLRGRAEEGTLQGRDRVNTATLGALQQWKTPQARPLRRRHGMPATHRAAGGHKRTRTRSRPPVSTEA